MKARAMILVTVAIGLPLLSCSIDSIAERDAATITQPPAPYVPEAVPQTRRFVILHTNDEHSHLLGFGPESVYPYQPQFKFVDVAKAWDAGNWAVDPVATQTQVTSKLSSSSDTQTVGGIVRRQYLINHERTLAAASDTPVLLLSAGDVMMGSLFHAAYAQDQAPDYMAMALLGYDFISLGNHEFDFGVDILASAIAAAQSLTFGSAPTILASNIHFDDVDFQVASSPGHALANLFGDPYSIAPKGNTGAPIDAWATRHLSNGLKVGFMALVGYSAALVAPGKSPIAFSTPTRTTDPECETSATCAGTSRPTCVRKHCIDPLDANGHLLALVADAQRVVKTLRDTEKVDVVVALTHLGYQEDQYLATNTTGIDVIIGGHSHDKIAPEKINGTLVTQAGDYGRFLGKLTITVDPDGNVDIDPAASAIEQVNYTVDSAMLTDAGQGAVKTAIAFTEGVMGPLVGGLNEALLPLPPSSGIATGLINGILQAPSPVTSIVGPIDGILSDHDVIGEVRGSDTYLSHLVTDAELERVFNHKCKLGAADALHGPVVAVQANGVIRESLRFRSTDHKTTLDDIFRVLPLGASPFESKYAAPGNTLLKFKLNAKEVLAGLDVGVTKGLENDDFFLSYSGMRTEYDKSRGACQVSGVDPCVSGGRIVKIELMNQSAGTLSNAYYAVPLYDISRLPNNPWKDPATGAPIAPMSYYVTVVTNLYLAGFLDALGLAPRDDDGLPITPCAGAAPSVCQDPTLGRLAMTALCFNPALATRVVGIAPIAQGNSCNDYGLPSPVNGTTAPVIECSSLGTPPWALAPEVKDWEALYLFLAASNGGAGLLHNDYAGATVTPADLRVKDVTSP